MTRKKPKKGSARRAADAPVAATIKTRIFKSGNSYAVRLPKPLYDGGEGPAYLTKLGDGRLLVGPKRKPGWPVGFFESFGTLPRDFEAPARRRANRAADARVAALFSDEE